METASAAIAAPGQKYHYRRRLTAFPKQLEWLNLTERRKAYVGGRGAGKTKALCIAALRELGKRKCSGTIVAPTYTMLRDVDWPMFCELCEGYTKVLRPSAHEVELLNGSVQRFRSADDPERLRGLNNSFFGIDEGALTKKDIWLIGLATLREHGGAGQAWVATTPRGRKNWVYEVFQSNRPNHAIVFASTFDNPFTSNEWKEDLRRDYGVGQWAEQELEGRFCDSQGPLIKREWLQIVEPESVPPKDKFVVCVRGWDLAVSTKASADFTAGVLLGLTADAKIYVLDVVRGKWEWPDARRVIRQVAQIDGVETSLVIETNAFQLAAFQEIYQDPELAPYPIIECKRERDKMSYALPLAVRAQQGQAFIKNASWTAEYVDELCIFDGTESSQSLSIEHRRHDDQVDATTNAFQHLVPPPKVERW